MANATEINFTKELLTNPDQVNPSLKKLIDIISSKAGLRDQLMLYLNEKLAKDKKINIDSISDFFGKFAYFLAHYAEMIATGEEKKTENIQIRILRALNEIQETMQEFLDKNAQQTEAGIISNVLFNHTPVTSEQRGSLNGLYESLIKALMEQKKELKIEESASDEWAKTLFDLIGTHQQTEDEKGTDIISWTNGEGKKIMISITGLSDYMSKYNLAENKRLEQENTIEELKKKKGFVDTELRESIVNFGEYISKDFDDSYDNKATLTAKTIEARELNINRFLDLYNKFKNNISHLKEHLPSGLKYFKDLPEFVKEMDASATPNVVILKIKEGGTTINSKDKFQELKRHWHLLSDESNIGNIKTHIDTEEDKKIDEKLKAQRDKNEIISCLENILKKHSQKEDFPPSLQKHISSKTKKTDPINELTAKIKKLESMLAVRDQNKPAKDIVILQQVFEELDDITHRNPGYLKSASLAGLREKINGLKKEILGPKFNVVQKQLKIIGEKEALFLQALYNKENTDLLSKELLDEKQKLTELLYKLYGPESKDIIKDINDDRQNLVNTIAKQQSGEHDDVYINRLINAFSTNRYLFLPTSDEKDNTGAIERMKKVLTALYGTNEQRVEGMSEREIEKLAKAYVEYNQYYVDIFHRAHYGKKIKSIGKTKDGEKLYVDYTKIKISKKIPEFFGKFLGGAKDIVEKTAGWTFRTAGKGFEKIGTTIQKPFDKITDGKWLKENKKKTIALGIGSFFFGGVPLLLYGTAGVLGLKGIGKISAKIGGKNDDKNWGLQGLSNRYKKYNIDYVVNKLSFNKVKGITDLLIKGASGVTWALPKPVQGIAYLLHKERSYLTNKDRKKLLKKAANIAHIYGTSLAEIIKLSGAYAAQVPPSLVDWGIVSEEELININISDYFKEEAINIDKEAMKEKKVEVKTPSLVEKPTPKMTLLDGGGGKEKEISKKSEDGDNVIKMLPVKEDPGQMTPEELKKAGIDAA